MPLRETDDDLIRERAAIDEFLIRRPDLIALKLPREAGADFVIADAVSKTVVGAVEVKCRTNPREQYPTFYVDLSKYQSLQWWRANGVPGLILVQWKDCAGYVSVPVTHTIGTAGRTDRNDPLDMDVVVFIDTAKFTIISTEKGK